MAEMREIASGLQFPEGPIAMPDGSVVLVEIKRGTLTRVGADGTVEVIAALGGGPNGAAVGPDGAVYVTNNGGFEWHDFGALLFPGDQPEDYIGGRIQRVDLETGEVRDLYTECNGIPLKGPNDIVFDDEGNFWFTDLGKNRARDMDRGGVYYASPDGSMIREVIFPLSTPNGIGLSPTGDRLYVADTTAGRLWAWNVTAPGEVEPAAFGAGGEIIADIPRAYFDSLAVEENGRVCVATLGGAPGVTSIDPATGDYELVSTDDLLTTNVAFGGDDMRTAYITLSGTGRLVATEWPRPGLRLRY